MSVYIMKGMQILLYFYMKSKMTYVLKICRKKKQKCFSQKGENDIFNITRNMVEL